MTAPRQHEGNVVQGELARLETRRSRLLATALALVVAIATLLSLLWPETIVESSTVHRRTSLHVAADSYGAFYALARRLGYRVERLRASYAALPPAAGTTLLCLDPLAHADLAAVYGGSETGQHDLLGAWLREGGHLLLTWPSQRRPPRSDTWDTTPVTTHDVHGAVFQDLPLTQWSPATGTLRGVGGLQGLRQPWPATTADDAQLAAAHLRRAGDQVEVQTFRSPPPDGWRPLLWLGEAPVLLEGTVGRGRVWAASTPFLFSTLALARHATAAPAVELLHTSSAEGRRQLLFDEYAHGQRTTRGLWWFVRHGPLGYPVAAALLLALLMAWRGASRLGPPAVEAAAPRRAKEEFVLGIADLEQRAGHARAAAHALLRAAERDADAEAHRGLAPLAQRLAPERAFDAPALVAFTASLDRVVAECRRSTAAVPSAPQG